MEPIERSEFEKAIGQLAIAWAVAEYGLDKCISAIFHLKGGDEIVSELPLNARAKIKFFRRAANTIGSLGTHTEWANEIVDLAYTTLDDRNWYIHGMALDVVPPFFEEPVTLTRFDRSNLIEAEFKPVTLAGILDAKLRCQRLSVSFGLFLCKPLDVLPEDHVKKVCDDLGIEVPPGF